jgi:ATPase subunit of ABC transporter with duplicated ATPase domains
MINAADITMRFGEKILFEGVSVKFRPGNRYGLIGANGAGKSTFMKILTGELEPSYGEVAIDRGCTTGYLKQDHFGQEEDNIIDVVYMGNEALWKLHAERENLYSKPDLTPEEMDRCGEVEELFGEAGGYTMETDAAKLLVGLGISETVHEQPLGSLAGGWKLRVFLAQVLFGTPDILLLDEPTNHLDISSIDWLVNFLKGYAGTVIVISHNRYFLNSVCTHTADLDREEMRLFTGNYDEFMITNEMLLEKMRRENATKERRASDLKDFINRFSANASKARQATSRQKELQKLEFEQMKPSTRVSPFIRFVPRERLGDKVIEVDKISKAYDETLFDEFSCTIHSDEKVAIIGTNGAGKTTLLKILINQVKPDTGAVLHGETLDIGHFPQDPTEVLDMDAKAMDWLSKFLPDDTMGETELRAAMGKMLFRGDAVYKENKVLSGGEKARMIVASLTMRGPNVLALDEPTNHLDLESIEALNYALGLVKNTILFVSHDREFIDSLATRILAIENGRIIDYPGTLSEYESWKAAQ